MRYTTSDVNSTTIAVIKRIVSADIVVAIAVPALLYPDLYSLRTQLVSRGFAGIRRQYERHKAA